MAKNKTCAAVCDPRAENGFTLIEMLVSILLLSVIMAAVFTFLWGASKYWQSGQETADLTENARAGLNRMTREMKQSSVVQEATSSEVQFTVQFDDSTGSETVTYGWAPGSGGDPGTVWRSSSTGSGQQTLINNVESVQFIYYGNDYRCDTDGDGLVTLDPELNGCSASPLTQISRVDVVLTMQQGSDSEKVFLGQAWLRNRNTVQAV